MSYQRRNYQEYVQGNTVRRLDSVPARRPERQERNRDEERKERVARRQAKERKIHNLMHFGMVSVAIIASLYLCITYVMVYSDMSSTKREIAAIERQIEKIKVSNEAAYAEIDSSVDLSYVYNKATKKLGMVPASGNQVYSYDNKKSDRVIMHNDIPK